MLFHSNPVILRKDSSHVTQNGSQNCHEIEMHLKNISVIYGSIWSPLLNCQILPISHSSHSHVLEPQPALNFLLMSADLLCIQWTIQARRERDARKRKTTLLKGLEMTGTAEQKLGCFIFISRGQRLRGYTHTQIFQSTDKYFCVQVFVTVTHIDRHRD